MLNRTAVGLSPGPIGPRAVLVALLSASQHPSPSAEEWVPGIKPGITAEGWRGRVHTHAGLPSVGPIKNES
jgi:hypothetical protein